MSTDRRYTLDSGEEIVCEEVVRSLPGKRQVFFGEYAGIKVVVKLFQDPRKGKRHWRREVDGLSAFNRCGIATARVLYSGHLRDTTPVIILERFVGLKSVMQAWGSAEDEEREDILRRMVVLLAYHHQAGLCQTDLHLDNFLISDHEIYSLDGAGVEVNPRGIEQETGLRNLALFVAQLLPEWESFIPEIYQIYAECRGWKRVADSGYLLSQVHVARDKRWRGFRKKLFRNCTSFAYEQTSCGFQVLARKYVGPELSTLLRDLDASFPGRKLAMKNGNTCTVWATKVDGRDLVIKRYNAKGFWHGVKLLLFKSRGENSWVNSHRLLFYGIPTPTPVALIKRTYGWLRPAIYLLTEEIKTENARKWFCASSVSREEKKFLADQVASMLAKLWRHKIVHGDLKGSNILIIEGMTMLIDLDAMCEYTDIDRFNKAMAKDVGRFLENWEADPYLLDLFGDALEYHGISTARLGLLEKNHKTGNNNSPTV